MHSKRIFLGLAIATLATGCGVLPPAPGTRNDDNPPAYVNVVRSDELHVRLVPQAMTGAQRNQHPAAFQPVQVKTLLGSLRLAVGDGQAAIGKILGPGLSADDAVTAVIAVLRLHILRMAAVAVAVTHSVPLPVTVSISVAMQSAFSMAILETIALVHSISVEPLPLFRVGTLFPFARRWFVR